MRLIFAAVIIALIACPAMAYTPHVGDRAAPITGRDAISDTVMNLEDNLGSWVFVDFWASWCGPCMGELPNMLAETRPYRDSGDLRLFTVSLDAMSTADQMNDVIKESGIDYPVIFDGNGWSTVQAQEWGIHSIPTTFLINPHGVIVASDLRGDDLAPALDFFINYDGDYAPAGLRTSHVLNDDGTVTVLLELCCPNHEPLDVTVEYYYTRYIWADDDPDHENRPIDREYIDGEELITKHVEFGAFGDAIVELVIPAVENTHRMAYFVEALLPETAGLFPDGDGLMISADGRVKLTK